MTPAPRKSFRSRLLLVLVLLTFCVFIAILSFPRHRMVIDYDFLAEINAPSLAVPESERAWTGLREALLGMDIEGRESILEFLNELDDETDAVRLAAWFNRHDELLGDIREALARDRLGFVHAMDIPRGDDRLVLLMGFERSAVMSLPSEPEDSGEVDKSRLTSLELSNRLTVLPRMLSRLLLEHAVMAANQGRSDVAVADIIACLNMGRLVCQDKLLISQLMGYAILSETYQGLIELMVDPETCPKQADLQTLARALADPRLAPLPIDLLGERAMIRDILQRLYSDDGSGNGVLQLEGFTSFSAGTGNPLPRVFAYGLIRPLLGPAMASLADSRAEVSGVAERGFLSAETLMTADPWSMDWTEHDAVAGLISSNNGGIRSTLQLYPLQLLFPSFEAMILRSHEIRFEFEFVTLLVALHRFRDLEGGWPETLDALVPEFLSRIPSDPHDGQPLRYRLLDGGPMLWSVGPDGLDQSGFTTMEEDIPGLRLERERSLITPPGEDLLLWPRFEDSSD